MKNKKGFTLVELLAVIVILGVLLLIAVPAVTGIQTKAKNSAAKDGALMFAKAIETCVMAQEGEPEICSDSNISSYYEDEMKEDKLTFTLDESNAITEFIYTNGNVSISYSGSAITISSLKQKISDLETGTMKNANQLSNN